MPPPLVSGVRRHALVGLKAIAACLTASLVGIDAAGAQQTTFIGEPLTTKRPLDVEVTPNGLVAVVRGHAPGSSGTDGLAFFDTATGLPIAMQGSCHVNTGQGGYFYFPNDYQPSDSLRVTNSRAILVGAYDSDGIGGQDRTNIDVVAIDTSGAQPTVTCLAHHEQGSTTVAAQIAGWTNDVEITPDESFAIVNSSNWIHVIDMATGSIAEVFNIGSPPYEGPCFAGDSVDSIATTNSTAVVTTTRTGVGSTLTRTWVYLIDLEASPSPTIVLEHELTYDLPDTRDYWPHDVTVTPNGSMAIVTANNAVAVYDLSQRVFLARDIALAGPTWIRRRFFSDIVDSVETTDSRFVTISTDDWAHGSPPCNQAYSSRYWVAEVYELPPSPDPSFEIAPLETYEFRDKLTEGPSGCSWSYQGSAFASTDTPHDLAVASEKNMAVIRTANFNVVLTDLVDPDQADIVLDPSTGVANNQPGSTSWVATNTFVSDSVLIAQPFIQQVLPPAGPEIHHYALTLGTEWVWLSATQKSWPRKAKVDVIDLNLTPPARVHTFEVEDPTSFPQIYPADFHLGPGAREFVLRCNASPNDPPPALGGRDFLRFELDTLSEAARIGGSGRVWAVDSIEVGRGRATSVGEDKPLSTGFVHVVGVQ